MQDNGSARETGAEMKLELGELRYLSHSLSQMEDPEKEHIGLNGTATKSHAPSLDTEQLYGNPLSSTEAELLVPNNSEGLIRHAVVVPDDFCIDGKLMYGLNKRDFDIEKGVIKPRRPSLPIRKSDLMSSLTKVDSENGSRYIFNGVLNGWPSLRHFELIKLEKKRTLPGGVQPPDYIMNSIGKTWTTHWNSDNEGKEEIPPDVSDPDKFFRATLRGATWTSQGWSPTSPGFLFWFEAQHPRGPRVVFGSDTVSQIQDDVCKAVHMISHRYATNRESTKDKLTYHSIVFLEWEESHYGTIVEGAFLNGIGGYKGKSNWYDDKNEEVTELYKALPPEMISPWLTTAAELRCYDVAARNLHEMKKFIEKYTGPEKRFLDPQVTFSHPARLSYRNRSNIAHYLLNYINRNCSYSELSRNCQTLAADLCSFLAGKKDVVPYHPINRIEYHNKAHLFLYESSMFKYKKGQGLRGKVAR